MKSKCFSSSFIRIVLQIFIVCLCGQLSLSQNNPQFPHPPVLIETLQKLHKNLNLSDADGVRGLKDFDLNYIKSKLILDNFVPSFLRNEFSSIEEFQLFAENGLYNGVSAKCATHSKELITQLLVQPLLGKAPATWAIQMIDAWGKFPSGVLSGHVIIPGDFHECLQIRGNYTDPIKHETENFKGKYCSTYLLPSTLELEDEASKRANPNNEFKASPKESVDPTTLIMNSFGANGFIVYLFPFIGTCFPSSCSNEDAQIILTNVVNATISSLRQYVVDCFIDEKPDFDAGDIAVISLLSVIGFLCLVGSIFDILVHRRRSDARSGTSLMAKIMLAFSVPLNTEKLLSTNAGSDNLGCLHGLRFLSMAWVVLAHTFVMTLMQFTWNLIDVQNIYKSWSMLTIINGTPSVDTFFTMSGALMGYNLLRELDRNKGRFNYFLMVIHRYLRLTPTYIILVAMMATIVPYFSYGPQWYSMDLAAQTCEKYWWYNALYINNLMNQTNVCYGESWYLANDMQFFLVAPLIIYPMWRWSILGFGILCAFSIASVVAPAVIQHEKELPPTNIPFITYKTYNEDLYVTPWARMGPYLAGIFLGYVLYLRAKNPGTFVKLPVWVVILGWLVSTASAILIIFGAHNFYSPANEADTLVSIESAIYAGVHRFGWGIIISWIIFACVSGYGGFVNRFLSWKVFMPLGRLTFCVYISSFHVQQLYHLSQPHPIHYSSYGNVNMYFAHMVMACLIGYILTITLESPFIQLEKLLMPTKKSPPKIQTTIFPISSNNGNDNKQI